MKRISTRTIFQTATVAVAVLATACLPAPPAPVYAYAAPVINSVALPSPNWTAGQPLPITIDISHEVAVGAVSVELYGPGSNILPSPWGCGTSADQVRTGTAAHATVNLTCTIPTIAGNGWWYAIVNVYADDSPSAYRHERFWLSGGSNDTSPPYVLTNTLTPKEVARNSEFTLTARLEEEHGPVRISAGRWTLWSESLVDPWVEGETTLYCNESATVVQVAPTLYDVSVVCRTTVNTPRGLYWGPELYPWDIVNHQGNLSWYVRVV